MYKLTDIYRLIKEEQQFGEWEIYSDADGVIVDFNKGFYQIAHMQPKEYEKKYGGT